MAAFCWSKCREVAWLMLKYVASPSQESFGGRFDVVFCLPPLGTNWNNGAGGPSVCLSTHTARLIIISLGIACKVVETLVQRKRCPVTR